MKKIVPFTKELMFKTKIGEITSIALDNTLKLDNNLVSGEFNINGTYKMIIDSQIEEKFNYNLPVDITIDTKYDTNDCIVSIDDFTYEIINEEKLKVNISVLLDNLNIKSEPILEGETTLIKEELIEEIDTREDKDFDMLFDSLDNIEIDEIDSIQEEPKRDDINTITDDLFDQIEDSKEYSVYRVYKVLEGDTIDLICEKYKTTKEVLMDYNDLDNLKIGNKIIIPSIDE